jgi:HK97 family phage portal protein
MKLMNLFRKKQKRSSGDVEININTASDDVSQVFGDGVGSLGMKIATVYRCVDIVSSTVAHLGLNMYRRKFEDIDGVKVPYFSVDENNAIDALLSFRPNDRLTAFELWKNTVSMILLKGNAYIYPRSVGGEIRELVLLAPDTVKYDVNNNIYIVDDCINSVYGTFCADEIIHLRNVCIDGGYNGVSTVVFAANALKIAVSTDTQEVDLFKSGSTLRGFVSGDGSAVQGFGQVQDEQLKGVAERIDKNLMSGQRIFQLPGVMKFNQLSLTPSDLQLLDSKKFNVLEICRFFGVHPDKVFSQTSTNYKASQNSQTVFMTDTLQPILHKIENELDVKLIPLSLHNRLHIRFNLQNYYESDLTTKSEYYKNMLEVGAMTVNDIRTREGRVPVDGGNKTFISCNVAPIDSPKIQGAQH